MNKYLIAPWRSLDDDDRNEDNHEDVDGDKEEDYDNDDEEGDLDFNDHCMIILMLHGEA